MRKKFVFAVFALIGLGTFVVLGSSTDFFGRVVGTLQQNTATNVFSPTDQLTDAMKKAGRSKSAMSKPESTAVEIPENVLWHVVFDFTIKIETKAVESNQQGKDGNLYSNYFIRQGHLSDEDNLILKQMANQYFQEVYPLDQRAKKITEHARAKYSKKTPNLNRPLPPPPVELEELQAQKDAITLRSRDSIKEVFGDETFNKFATFLKTDFSEGARSRSVVMPSRPESPMSFVGFTWIIWDDGYQPPLITGLSELYFFYTGGFYYDPSVDSFFANFTSQTLLESGRDDGYRNFFPAQFFHSIFFSIRGNQYCTLTDFYSLLYDGPILIEEAYLGSSNPICHVVGPGPPPSPTPTPNVRSVTFSQVQPSSEPISPNPAVMPHNPGIGQRMFPDDDSPQDSVDRRLVRVTATLSQPIPNVPVYFRNFDLDDPASDTTIDPNGTPGNDNNGTPMAGQLLIANGCGANGASVFCPTNSNGVATIDFVVTRQPGDNFAIAASISPVQVNAVNINGIELTNASGQNIPLKCSTATVCRSQMLTVWRRLHIEVDSMGNSIQNRAIGTIMTTTRIRTGQTVEVPLNPTSPALLETNRFEGGRFFANSRSFVVTCNLSATPPTTCNTGSTVTVRNTGPLVTLFADTPFELYDDDDFNDNNGTTLNGDTGEPVPEPDRTMLQSTDTPCPNTITASNCNVFASAYIRPAEDLTGNQGNVAFQNNISDPDIDSLVQLYFQNQMTESSQTFWTIYLLGAYQHQETEDSDPDISDATYGVTGTLESTVFLELARSKEYQDIDRVSPPGTPTWSLRPIGNRFTTIHEIGHLFGCNHTDGGTLTTDYGVMGINTTRSTAIFNNFSLRIIRARTNP
jgi:hypothetical protein